VLLGSLKVISQPSVSGGGCCIPLPCVEILKGDAVGLGAVVTVERQSVPVQVG
jgi:hypothetical protein